MERISEMPDRFWPNKATALARDKAIWQNKATAVCCRRAPCILAEQSHRYDFGIGLSFWRFWQNKATAVQTRRRPAFWPNKATVRFINCSNTLASHKDR
jgi:hypothetical protein